jgi:hypothetical protein
MDSKGPIMKKKISVIVVGIGLALGAGFAYAQAAPVATITDIDGKDKVSVNQGEGFVPAAEGMRLKPGDRIMVQDDSEATIKYDDECRREIDENKIATVGDKSPCAGGALAEQGLEPASDDAIGATGATESGNGGVVAMAAIVAAIDIWWLNEDDHDTASP